MTKSSLENRLLLFAASHNACEEVCRVIPGKKTNSFFLHLLSNSVSSEFISDLSLNVSADFTLFIGTFSPDTLDFIFIYD